MLQVLPRNSNLESHLLALSAIPVEQHRKLSGEAWLSALIADLPLSAHRRNQILPGTKPTLIDKLQLLAAISPKQRINFVNELIDRTLSSASDRPLLLVVLKLAGHYLEKSERELFLCSLMDRIGRTEVAKCWTALASSAKNSKELYRLVNACGYDQLVTTKNRELRDLLTTIVIVHEWQKIKFSSDFSSRIRNTEVLNKIENELKEKYTLARKVLADNTWARGSSRYTKFVSLLKISEKQLNKQLKAVESAAELNEVLRVGLCRLALELKYGKAFLTCSQNREEKVSWSLTELDTVAKALKTTGELNNILANYFEFRRCKVEIDNSTGEKLVAGFESGSLTINLSDLCFSRAHQAARGGDTPEETIIHEIGHAFSMTAWNKIKSRINKATLTLADIMRDDHFPEIFLKLGRWDSANNKFKIDRNNRFATINKRTVALDTPVYIEGETRVYSYDPSYRLLYWYAYPQGEFPAKADGRIAPIEQFSEGFTDYHKNPERLIENAPNFFWYLESLYHRYSTCQGSENRVINLLRRRLADPTLPTVGRQQSIELCAFSLLSRTDQIEVLGDLGINIDEYALESASSEQRRQLFIKRAAAVPRYKLLLPVLQQLLANYNPGILLGRALLQNGEDLAVVSIRGTNDPAQDYLLPLRQTVKDALGDKFNHEQVYFLNDARRSRNLAARTYHGKLATLIVGWLTGYAPRRQGRSKSLPKRYEKVVVYTNLAATITWLERFASQNKLQSSLQVIDLRRFSSDQSARYLLSSREFLGKNDSRVLHVMTLEETLLDLPAKYGVVVKESGRRLLTIELSEALLRDNQNNNDVPYDWIKAALKIYEISRKDLIFDDSEFRDPLKLHRQLMESWQNYQIFKGLRQ